MKEYMDAVVDLLVLLDDLGLTYRGQPGWHTAKMLSTCERYFEEAV